MPKRAHPSVTFSGRKQRKLYVDSTPRSSVASRKKTRKEARSSNAPNELRASNKSLEAADNSDKRTDTRGDKCHDVRGLQEKDQEDIAQAWALRDEALCELEGRLSLQDQPIGPTTPQSLLQLPNASSEDQDRGRARAEFMVELHVQSFSQPYTTGVCTNTGARKHSWTKGISMHTSYTPDVGGLVTNTGTVKGAWASGVDADTGYAGDVELFPQVDCVHKGIWLDNIKIAVCDEPLGYLDKAVQTEHQIPKPLLPGPSAAPESTRLVASLRTSEEPTFLLTGKQPVKIGPKVESPVLKRSMPEQSVVEPSAEKQGLKHVSFALQSAMKAEGIPANLNELEDLTFALAKDLNIAPVPGFLDAYGGRYFDLGKGMNMFGLPLQYHDPRPIDHSATLLGLLNFGVQGEEGKAREAERLAELEARNSELEKEVENLGALKQAPLRLRHSI